MAEVGYNSKFEGQEVDSRLENVVQAAPGTGSESGKGGLIPAPPAGSQDGSKTLLSNMTWGDYVTKQYIDDAVSAAGWKKQIVSKLPTVEEAKDNITLGKLDGDYYYLNYFLEGNDFENNFKLKIVFASFANTDSAVGASEYDIEIQVGTFVVIQDKTYEVMNNMVTLSNTILSYLNFMAMPPKVVTTLANLPKGAHNIIANVASATNLSMTVSSEYVGREWQVRVNNTTGTDITQPLPTSGQFQSMSGDSVVIPKNSFIELSIWYINDKLVIRVGEQA